ncbi:MAG: NAD(P)/FAD-dependent oxidoreductase [Actinobacteria bacterium]|nr:NAD(P)/FAD-dependent oxidoreductase [Actinomycetota bacterium]
MQGTWELAGTPDEEIERALAGADLRVLVVLLAQLTGGDDRWFQPRYQPAFDINLFSDPDAGLSVEAQAEVRAAALEVLIALRDGKATLPPPPDEHLMAKLMTLCMGEPVGPEYAPMMLEQLGFRPADVELPEPPRREALESFHVVVIGAGVSGLCAAIKLERLGISYTVLEKNDSVGGTWYENSYPDCGVDTPNHFYSFSFAPNHDWSCYFSKRDELHAYLQSCAHEFGVLPHIRFGTTVVGADFDDEAGVWDVTARDADGNELRIAANAVVCGIGQLNRPKLPTIEGMETFAGPSFHSSRWRHDIDLEGLRVAVIGTGASAIQLVRTTAERAGRLTIFQRSPQWVLSNPDYYREVDDTKKWLLHNVPHYAAWYRFILFYRFADALHGALQIDPDWPHPDRSINAQNDRHREYLTRYIRAQVGDRTDLLPKVIPSYPPWGKRMLMDNDWFKTLKRDNVELVDDAIRRITPTGVELADGRLIELDVIVYATGFETTRILGSLEFRGRGGQSLAERWGDDDARANLGITVPGFPNLFFLYGPNTNLAHGGSIIFHAECQVRYVMGCLTELIARGAQTIECTPEAYEEYNRRVDDAVGRMVWAHPGATNWYRNSAGRVVCNSPWRLVDYWQMTREPNFEEFRFDGAAAGAGSTELVAGAAHATDGR